MNDGEFGQVVDSLKTLNIDGLMAIQRRNTDLGQALLITLKWDTDNLAAVLRQIENEIESWSYAHEVAIYFEFHD